jgi:hypothetical protein
MDNNKKIFFKTLLIVFSLGIASNIFGIGMVTDPIVVKDMLRGGEIIKTITVFNPEKTKAVYSFGTTGQIAGWAKFFEKDDLKTEITTSTIPVNTYYDIIAKIKVPKDISNGQYEGEIFVKQEPKVGLKQEENTVSISQMVSRKVTITVSDKEVVNIKTTLIPSKYDFKKGESLKVKIIYDNQGNIALKPSLQLKITDLKSEKTVFNAIFPYPEEEESVAPGEVKTMSDFEWQTTGQPESRYLVEINTLLGDKVLEKNNFSFNIGSTSFSDAKNKGNFFASIALIGGGNLLVAWIIIGLALIALAVFLKTISKKKNSKASPDKT